MNKHYVWRELTDGGLLREVPNNDRSGIHLSWDYDSEKDAIEDLNRAYAPDLPSNMVLVPVYRT